MQRASGQFRFFARVCHEGSYVEAIIDHAQPDMSPPRHDLRRMLIPLGPVGVFGASNFPFAFSVAGGDVASALAAGCSVVVKAHPSHPETSQLTGQVIARALATAGAPDGAFSLIQGRGTEVGGALVSDPGIKAVGFTGSLRGGRALYDLAAARPEPIPVYAEMGSVNPFFITEAALIARGAAIAKAFTGSMTLGTGQLCTKPGLAFVPAGAAGDEFVASVIENAKGLEPGYLLNASLLNSLTAKVDGARKLTGVNVRTGGTLPDGSGFRYPATVVEVSGETFTEVPELREEYFGPFAMVVRYESLERLLELVRLLAGNLTATLHAEREETVDVADLVDMLREKVGRLIWNGFPTGVAVTHAMVHGGPYPATTIPLHTSVGSTAMKRFLRPVAYQSYPEELLPPALRDGNPLGILRLEDGKWVGGGLS